MLIDFFMHLKKHKLNVSITEYLSLLEALEKGFAGCSIDEFYTLARLCLIKNESSYDKFDVAFAEYLENMRTRKKTSVKTPEDIADLPIGKPSRSIGDTLASYDLNVAEKTEETRTLNKEDEEEKGSSLNGGGGNNPAGEGGVHQEGVRIDNYHLGNRSAVKAWDTREFRGLDDDTELNVRSIKIALRRLRKFAREGIPDEFDLDETISHTAKNAGFLDIRMRPERQNKVKVLLMFDIGGSMDPYVNLCKELFTAARSEFKQLEYFYFHNCVGDSVWRYNGPHLLSHYPLPYIMNRFGKDYKLIMVGDASMSPAELTDPGVGYNKNETFDSGEMWLRRLFDHYRSAVWLNPETERFWHLTQSIMMIRDLIGGRMMPLTLSGLEQAMKVLLR